MRSIIIPQRRPIKCTRLQPKISIRISPVQNGLSRVILNATGGTGQLKSEATPETHKRNLKGFSDSVTSDNIYVDNQSFSPYPSESYLESNPKLFKRIEVIHYPARTLRGSGFFRLKGGFLWIVKNACRTASAMKGVRWAYAGSINIQSAKFADAFLRGKICALTVRIPRIYKDGKQKRISGLFSRMMAILSYPFGKRSYCKPNFTHIKRWRYFSEV